ASGGARRLPGGSGLGAQSGRGSPAPAAMDEERALYIVRAGEAGAIERVLRDYSDKHRATFKFESTDEDKRKSDSHQFRVMAAVLRHCLLIVGPTEDKTEELHSNAVNLLSNVPVSCLDVLICPLTHEETAQEATTLDELPSNKTAEKETVLKNNTMVYNGMNMEAIHVLLNFMEKRIDKGSSYREGLTPVLSLLTECSRAHRNIRKFLKDQVLPPLRDVTNRPEVGSTVRNKLVRLMTHVDLGVKQIAAEFLFVLCKERVDSLLKYTGYGNAAGL
ncbi:RIC8B isoform 11, partial [Pan troglodytes]